MELYPPTYGSPPYPFLLPPSYLYSPPQNYVRWNQTPEAHIYTADLPGVRKEEIRVEVEDGRYLVIRTELEGGDDDDDEEMEVEERRRRRRRRFMRKFRLPETVDVERISAGYEDGVLTVRAPRRLLSRRPRVEDVVIGRAAEERNSVARAA